jgi:carboxylate-amine ligase
MDFRASEPLTYGLELELQIVDRSTGRLTPGCVTLLDALARQGPAGHYAQEATLATIELNSSVHHDAAGMAAEMDGLVRRAREAARANGFDLRGGGTHLAQFWNERVMSSTARAQALEQRFGFLPKRFSTYGMHVHVGMPDAESALRVANVLQALGPLFIALSAASPFLQLADTGFACCRPLEPLVYPQGGPMPFLRSWQALEEEVQALRLTGIAHSLKDIYWDVRPKPEFGTVEVRVFDTPLQLDKALHLASLTRHLAALALADRLVLEQPPPATAQQVSRFMACRHGLAARLYDPFQSHWVPAREWLGQLFNALEHTGGTLRPQASDLSAWRALLHEAEEHALMRSTWADIRPETTDDEALLRQALVRNSEVMCARLLAHGSA